MSDYIYGFKPRIGDRGLGRTKCGSFLLLGDGTHKKELQTN